MIGRDRHLHRRRAYCTYKGFFCGMIIAGDVFRENDAAKGA